MLNLLIVNDHIPLSYSDDKATVPKVTDGKSPVLVNASSNVAVHYSEKKGRHVLVTSFTFKTKIINK